MKCQYPDCTAEETHTWALVPLCAKHCESIRVETAKFYSSTDSRHEVLQRPMYLEIDYKIPWSKRSLAMSGGEWR